MKRFALLFVSSLVAFNGANAANNARPAMSAKMVMPAPRYTASINQLGGDVAKTKINAETVQETTNQKDMRESERNACVNNNIGLGNTFVWASRYSDTSNYANMVEDVENPENNVCFVRVELKSDDTTRVDVSDVPAKYFMWGENIECGSWANADEMEKRILDTRKGVRIGSVVASSVGGAGLGVGSMELFGNRLIGNGLEGQRGITDKAELYRAQLLTLRENKDRMYDVYINHLKTLRDNPEVVENDSDLKRLISLMDAELK